MAKEKLEKQAQPNDFKRKKSNKNKPNKNKKGVLNKKQSQKNNAPKKTQEKKHKNNKKPMKPDVNVRIAFLGGLNEVGKNMTLYECQNDMILVDCGLAFPEPDMLGVDLNEMRHRSIKHGV